MTYRPLTSHDTEQPGDQCRELYRRGASWGPLREPKAGKPYGETFMTYFEARRPVQEITPRDIQIS